jgi:hypothetical protein
MEYEKLYNQFLNLLKKANLVFSYLCLDELYTFYGKKKIKFIFGVGVTKIGRKFYFYYLSKRKNIDSLLSFNFDLPIRKTKAHAKSFKWLNQRVAMFFVELNLKSYKI